MIDCRPDGAYVVFEFINPISHQPKNIEMTLDLYLFFVKESRTQEALRARVFDYGQRVAVVPAAKAAVA